MGKINLQKFITRRMAPYTSDFFMQVVSNADTVKKYTGLSEAMPHSAFLDGDYFVDADWTKEMTNKYYTQDPEIFWNFTKKGVEVGDSVFSYIKSNYKHFNNAEDFWDLQEKLCRIASFLQLTHPMSKAVENHVAEILKNKGVREEEIIEALLEVSAPNKLNGPSMEIKELSEIKKALETNPAFDVDVAISKHTEKWSYLGYRDCFSLGYTEEFFKKRLNDNITEKGKVINKFNFSYSEQENEWIELIKEYVFFRNYRTEMLYGSFFYAEFFWKAFSVKNGLGEKDLSYYLVDEIKSLINDGIKLSNEEILSRKQAFGIVMDFSKTIILTGKSLQDKILDISEKLTDINEIKGTIACRGIIKGKVKIVSGSKNQDKVDAGDILVTSMTTPDLLPSMGRASAFITDEGGITCHAAIVAREMKKPCIIGTKNATRILKDGDMVEVDADKGVVRIIK